MKETTIADYRALLKAQRQRGPNAESEIVTAILDYLHAVGIVAARTQAGEVALKRGGYMRLAPAGWPDISGYVVCVRARPLFIEVKAPGGSCLPEQAAFLDAAGCAGCLCIVASSIDDVRAAFRLHGVVTREME